MIDASSFRLARQQPMPKHEHDKTRAARSALGDLGRHAGLGFQFAAVLALFALGGWWLDEELGTRPWLLVLGCLLGAVGATIALVRAVPSARTTRRPPV
jgi:F0F1-type ATP synthase assembly protein I